MSKAAEALQRAIDLLSRLYESPSLATDNALVLIDQELPRLRGALNEELRGSMPLNKQLTTKGEHNMTVKTNDLLGAQLDCAVAQAEGISSAAFQPSTNWAHGGPIIEREKICADYLLDGRWLAVSRTTEKQGIGPTPLIAAMRCYVASKLGDTVETNN